MTCKLHPDYRGGMYPRGQAAGCICLIVYAFRHALRLHPKHIRTLVQAAKAKEA